MLDGSNKHRFSCEQRVLIPLSYSCEGEKALKITLFSDKDTLECYTKINIAATGDEPKPAFIIHADSGKIIGRTKLKSTNPDFIEGQTDGTIFPGTDKQPIFDRPVIVAEGWDPQNEVHGEGKVLGVFDYYYNALKGYGYDIVVINFKGSSRSIQDNAADFNAIIKDINKLKNDNGSYHENIVIGECMGSLVARYGLLKMENELYDHQTGLYVSFDAPMGGANLPAGLQFVLDDLNDFDVISSLGLDGGEIQNLVNAQEAPIVKQMSLFYKGPNPDPMFNTYRAELTSMGGYPKKLRKITVINGSNTEELQTNSCTSGQKILNISANLPLWRCNIDAWSHTPDAYPLIERYTSEIYIPIGFGLYFWYENDNEPIEFNFGHYWWDNKAGGYLDKTNDVLTAVANAEVNEVQATNFGRGNITFTPTYSSLDADPILGFNENFYWSLGRVNYVAQKFTPFDDIYAQSKNTYHIRRDEDNIKPLFEKIFDYELMRNFLYLQNRTTNKKLAFTSKEIFVGNNIEPLTTTDRLSISTGDFIVDVGGDLKLKAENKIIFKPGSKVKRGGKLWAVIQSIQNLKSAQENTYIDQPILEKNENTYSVSNASKNSKYSWTLQPGNYQLSGNSVELPSNLRPGLYTLECKAENTNGSSALSTVVKVANTKAIISINTSVNSKAQKPWFKLLQNPVNANLEAAFCINSETPVRISLYNTQGLAVTTLIINKPNIGKNKVTINMSNLPIGMYYLKFESQLLTNNIKVVKIK